MKIHQILGSTPILITNEEEHFIESHHKEIPIRSLFDRDEIIARNLVRKGVYEISNDSNNLILKEDANQRKTLI